MVLKSMHKWPGFTTSETGPPPPPTCPDIGVIPCKRSVPLTILSSIYICIYMYIYIQAVNYVVILNVTSLCNLWGCVLSVCPSPLWWLREYILCLIDIIKSEVWTITYCLGLSHETMVCAVCLSIFSSWHEETLFTILTCVKRILGDRWIL